MSLKEIDRLLNRDSGLKGICGANDMREVLKKRDAGDNLAQLAVEIYCYRIKKYIGAFFAAIGDLHAPVFTGGIGENAPEIRELSCHGLGRLGIKINAGKNNNILKLPAEIESRQSKVKIVVIPTNEELKIARETKNIIEMERHDEINRVDRVERP
jgi:acetate kinase